MKALIPVVLTVLLAGLHPVLATAPAAAAEPAGKFDYYVMALSWQPSWCASEGDARGAPTCRDGTGTGFILHGLWPQRIEGWPEYCRAAGRDATREETGAMADIMGSGGLAWHQWKKHGRCSGLSPRDYFEKARTAFEKVKRPSLLREIGRPVRIDASVVEAAFLDVNAALTPASTVVTCRGRWIREVRICLTREHLMPRPCTGSVARACTKPATLPPPR
ncbi:MAG: ribonuclease T2 [Pseudomonadota bacterium]